MTAEPFTEARDFARVLASLPEDGLLSMVEMQSKTQNPEWLKAMIDVGLLDASPVIDLINKSPGKDLFIQGTWAARCDAFLGVMKTCHLASVKVNGAHSKTFEAKFEMAGATKNIFERAIDHLAVQCTALRAHALGDPHLTDHIMTQCMGLAAMMDRPELIARLVASHPTATKVSFGDHVLGHMFSAKHDEKNCTFKVTPLFCAIEFSRPACIEALLSVVPLDSPVYEIFGDFTSEHDFRVSMSSIEHRCTPESITPLLQQMVQAARHAGSEKADLMATALNLTLADTHDKKNAYLIPAFVAAGVFALDPIRTVKHALAENLPWLLDHLQAEMPWDELKGNKYKSNCPLLEAIEGGRDDVVFKLFDLAQSADRLDALKSSFVGKNDDIVFFAANVLIGAPLGHKVLPMLLDLGLKPDAPVQGMECNFAVMAKAGSDVAANIVHSYLARAKTRALLAELDDASVNRGPRT